jgi:hypothetical protein
VTPPPPIVKAGASAEERARITEARRSHPLYSSCVLMLITEIINSRLFTTVSNEDRGGAGRLLTSTMS